LALEFINAGFRAILTCVDSRQLDSTFVGRTLNRSLLADLPPEVDPSGENGEFHTFVYEGPIFSKSIPVRKGEIVLRENRFYYCDLLLDSGG
jgi:diphthamide synthase (EF-2-diphthine--ammonia ligase)